MRCGRSTSGLLISGSLVRAQQAEPKSKSYDTPRRALRHILVAAAYPVLLAGCSSIPTAEKVWMLTHAIDVAQTVQIARSSCYQESDEITSRIIGEDPSVGEALAWGVGLAGVHYGVTRWLESIEAPRWLQGSWQALTIGNTAYFIKQNNDQGIKPWGADC